MIILDPILSCWIICTLCILISVTNYGTSKVNLTFLFCRVYFVHDFVFFVKQSAHLKAYSTRNVEFLELKKNMEKILNSGHNFWALEAIKITRTLLRFLRVFWNRRQTNSYHKRFCTGSRTKSERANIRRSTMVKWWILHLYQSSTQLHELHMSTYAIRLPFFIHK